jgi:hypothetical protein
LKSKKQNKINLLTEYISVTQKVLFGKAVLAALISGRKYGVILQNGYRSRESNVRTLVFRNKVRYQNATSLQNSAWKNPPSGKAIRRWLKQFREAGNVLHLKGAGRPSTSQEDVDRIQEAFSRSPQTLTRRASLQLGIPQTTFGGLFKTAFTSMLIKYRLCRL